MDRCEARRRRHFDRRPEVSAAWKMARSWRQGYAPDAAYSKMTVKTDVQNITAFRLELLNDPNLP